MKSLKLAHNFRVFTANFAWSAIMIAKDKNISWKYFNNLCDSQAAERQMGAKIITSKPVYGFQMGDRTWEVSR